ncbi:MAG: hypothetical protein HFJ10_13360 [Lachnospiraceae bacterium]|nr:hypothetical protein [Lachnospiraceae bacterium]
MRVTTGLLIRNYRNNLNNSITNLDLVRTKVETQRQFTKAYQNPTGQVRAAGIYKKYAKTEDYISTIENTESFLKTQEDAIMQVNTQARYLSKQYGLEAMNATNWSYDVRKTYAEAFRSAQESMTMSMNASYGDTFVFAGAVGNESPFRLLDDGNGGKKLTYRGVDVTTGDIDMLDEMAAEKINLDMGFGLEMDGNDAANSTAFDTALPGIRALGYGEDDNGYSKNIVVLAGKLADLLDEEDFDSEEYTNVLNAFDEARKKLIDNVTTLGTKSNFLSTTKDRLEDQQVELNTQLKNTVDVDMADAITEYMWAQYAYNATLKIGTSILTPSFIDFMS